MYRIFLLKSGSFWQQFPFFFKEPICHFSTRKNDFRSQKYFLTLLNSNVSFYEFLILLCFYYKTKNYINEILCSTHFQTQ
jgi:hypothetical protein